jgi:hypothetical protein
MGHFFIYDGSVHFTGVNFKGNFLVARRDLFDQIKDDAMGLASKTEASKGTELMSNLAKRMQYPNSYISEAQAKNKYNYAYNFEKKTYDFFSNLITKEVLNFNSKDIPEFKINFNDLSSVIGIFLTNNEKFDFEIIPNTTIIKIFKKQGVFSKLFLHKDNESSTIAFDTKNVKNFDCSPEEIKIHTKDNLTYTLRRN